MHNVLAMDFIDRHDELERLNSLWERPEGGLAVLWGRRRVGKTRLLIEWSSAHDGLYTVADPSAAPVQRRYFAQGVAERFPGFDEVTYPDWKSLLRRLSGECARRGWRGPLILDEIPHLIAADRSFPGILQNWIDGDARTARMVVAMAGSSQRMMQGAVLDASAPLYGRATEMLEIKPLLPGYLSRAFGSLPPRKIAELHALWGGIPRYWELAQPFGDSLEESLDHLVLDSSGPLHAEPDRLLMQESPSAASLRPILDLIGAGVHRMSEIAGRLGQPATSLSRPLSRLIELGLVKREIPFGEKEKSGKLALYRIEDPFFRLWFSVVAPHRALLAASPRETRLAVWKKLRSNLEAQAWEDLCRASVAFLHTTDSPLGVHGPWMPARRYWRRGEPEWDVVASSVDGEKLLLGEVKWLANPADAGTLRAIAAELEAKGVPSVTRSQKNLIRAAFIPLVRGGVRSSSSIIAVDCRTVLACLV